MQIDNITYRSPNHHLRKALIDCVVWHTTEGEYPDDVLWLCKPAGPTHKKPVSCHFYIRRTGQVYQLVDLSQVAWHAGVCNFRGRTDWSSPSIGIELEHKAGQDWPLEQLQAAQALGRMLTTMYKLPRHMHVCHRWIAWPRWPVPRKYDPTDMDDNAFAAFIAAFYPDPIMSEERTYNVKKTAVLGVNIREQPGTKARILGSLWPWSKPFRGILTTHGEPFKNDARWVKRTAGGYVWFGQLELVP